MRETSPHTRGKRFFQEEKTWLDRNIPAYAGKAGRFGDRRSTFRKHPRIRGESAFLSLLSNTVMETSPHTRGKLSSLPTLSSQFRNIPAYAGKAENKCQPGTVPEKHPRIRGESYQFGGSVRFVSETSPHTRGKLLKRQLSTLRRGNIPAYAGKAGSDHRAERKAKKHPRIRGESQFLHL